MNNRHADVIKPLPAGSARSYPAGIEDLGRGGYGTSGLKESTHVQNGETFVPAYFLKHGDAFWLRSQEAGKYLSFKSSRRRNLLEPYRISRQRGFQFACILR